MTTELFNDAICKVIDISNFSTKRNLEYQLLTVEMLTFSEKKGKYERSGIIAKRCLWKEREFKVYNKETHQLHNHKYPSDIFYNTLQISKEFVCTIGIIPTTQYTLNNVIYNSANVIIYNEIEYLKETAKQLNYLGINAKPLDKNGKTYNFVSQLIEVDENGCQVYY